VSPYLEIFSVTVGTIQSKSLSIPIEINCERNENVETLALIDSGAGGEFIDQNYAKNEKFEILKLEKPLLARNVDGTTNKSGTITSYVNLTMTINGRTERTQLLVTGLGKQRIILGFPWLNKHNPNINWQTGHLAWRNNNRRPLKIKRYHSIKSTTPTDTLATDNLILSTITEELATQDEEWIQEETWICSKTSASIEFHLQHDEKKDDLPLDELIPSEYHEFLDTFDEQKADRFPESRPWDHKIELKEGFQPKSFKTYNLTPEEQTELDKFLKDNLDKGYIRPSQSPMATPFFFVKKKDGKLRPCQDYRYLNDWTIKNAYPLPLISELTDKLKGAKYFTKLDVRWGYNNVRIKDGDQWKAAFKTNKGLFEPTVMFFGMCNSPATFQSMMDDIFQDLTDEGIVIIYMDDIFLYAEDQETLKKNTKRVLQRLKENDLYLKPKKCEFHKTRIEWLGMIIEEGKISMDSGKLKGIQDWPVPTTVKQVRGFLGFGNFYRRFIKHFSEVAKPLNDLLKKDRKFEWTKECQDSFDELKKRFTEEPVILMPDHTKPFQIECDASKYASGAVLTQLDSNGDRHPCAFISKTFSPTERNYEIYDRELLALIRALEEWRHYIQGSAHTTTVYSDHKNLTFYREARKLNRRQARWSLYLSEFDVKLVHMAGNKMIQSDALSRRPDFVPDEDTDNEDIVMLPENLFINLLDLDLQKRIANCDNLDKDATDALAFILQDNPMMLRNDLDDWRVEDVDGKKILFYRGRNYIPMDTELRRDITRMFHDHETAGHPGELETFNAIRQHYWWPGLRTFVKNYVRGCGPCQQFKIDRSPSKPSFYPTEGSTSTRPFAYCSMDFITDLPLADGFDSILVVVDQGLTKGVILLACQKTITAEETAKLLLENLYKRFGLPDKIISDRGPQFASKAFVELLKLLGIKSALSTAYHPQTDGTTERVNQEIEAYLSIYCTSHPEEWPRALHTMEFTHNNRRHADRQKTPFELMFGDSPIAIPHSFENTKYPSIEDKMKTMIKNREEALAAHELARTRIAERRKTTFIPFRLGDKVWLDTRNLKTNHHKKMAPRREGPFEITEVIGPVTYRLKLPQAWKVHNVFHATLLRQYRETEVYGTNFPRPPPELVEGEEVYEVENILRHRRRGRHHQYYVKWKGYPIEDATWESEDAFSDDGDLLTRYKERHQL
jgi:transposase InsO family protein